MDHMGKAPNMCEFLMITTQRVLYVDTMCRVDIRMVCASGRGSNRKLRHRRFEHLRALRVDMLLYLLHTVALLLQDPGSHRDPPGICGIACEYYVHGMTAVVTDLKQCLGGDRGAREGRTKSSLPIAVRRLHLFQVVSKVISLSKVVNTFVNTSQNTSHVVAAQTGISAARADAARNEESGESQICVGHSMTDVLSCPIVTALVMVARKRTSPVYQGGRARKVRRGCHVVARRAAIPSIARGSGGAEGGSSRLARCRGTPPFWPKAPPHGTFEHMKQRRRRAVPVRLASLCHLLASHCGGVRSAVDDTPQSTIPPARCDPDTPLAHPREPQRVLNGLRLHRQGRRGAKDTRRSERGTALFLHCALVPGSQTPR